jgi:hypothetical protein
MRFSTGRMKTKGEWALYDARCKRLQTMLTMKGPPVLTAIFARHVVEAVYCGPWRALWWHFRQVLSMWWGFQASRLWHFWHRRVRRRTPVEIEAMLDAECAAEEDEEEWQEIL